MCTNELLRHFTIQRLGHSSQKQMYYHTFVKKGIYLSVIIICGI